MASILYAWEFGANLGHVGAFMPLARSLREQVHTVHWVVTQPAQVGDFLAQAGFSWLPAPTTSEQMRQGPPLSYADILLRFGYADEKSLFGLVGAWRELMRLTGTQLVLADHAPTAVLAARTLGLPVMLFSNGFTVPPRLSPMPNMRPWVQIPAQTFVELDRLALRSINAVLTRLASPTLTYLANLFDVAEETLVTFPELDHYTNRGSARYWGSLPSAGTGVASEWPAGAGARIFAYLRRECAHHEAVLAALLRLGQPTIIYFPGLPGEVMQRYQAPHMLFLSQPADIAQMTREADVAVTYASLATTTAFLLAGKPLLLLPSHLEQFLVARRVVEMGAGILVSPEHAPKDLQTDLQALATQPTFRHRAQAFAKKYAAFGQDTVIDNLVRRINGMLDEASQTSPPVSAAPLAKDTS